MLIENAAAAKTGFESLLCISMGVDVFASDWLHCDRISSYVARMVSHNRTDSVLYSNLMSSALNELLETAYRCHGERGELSCRVLRDGRYDRIELEIPSDDKARAFFAETAEVLARDDAAEQYRAALFADGPVDPRIGLLELCVDYAAKVQIEVFEAGAILLTAQFDLETEFAHA
ncbi:MAG TPA: ubiquinone biosynthesis methyltransferase UbiE [Devosiaceae bacterium]|nr:ubiquinone biosynthesis methyltransferase UbiE [Devosiaceae bacterium]